jgi:hypothetical protein
VCEYLVYALRSNRLVSQQARRDLKSEARRQGYDVQLDAEIPSTIRGEVSRIVQQGSPSSLLNITTRPGWNCIDETLSAELDYFSKKPIGDVAIFQLIRWIIHFAEPFEATLLFVDGAEVGWFPLNRRVSNLSNLLESIYEYHDRPDLDVHGIYDINL